MAIYASGMATLQPAPAPASAPPAVSSTRRILSWITGHIFAATLYGPPLLPSLESAWHRSQTGQEIGFLISAGLIAWLAPMVSYRRRDWLFLFVPVWDLVVLYRIGSRLARVEARDWPQRPDEIAPEPGMVISPEIGDIGQSFQPPISTY